MYFDIKDIKQLVIYRISLPFIYTAEGQIRRKEQPGNPGDLGLVTNLSYAKVRHT